MKKISIKHIMLTAMALACANTLNAKNISAFNPLAGRYQHENSSEKLVLNNGAKWKVDGSTNGNVDNLKLILKGFDYGTDKSLKAYKIAGHRLQNGLAKMIKECRMQGSNHLALHKWLEPFMAQAAKLEQATTTGSAAQSTNFIRLQLNRYNQFFEL